MNEIYIIYMLLIIFLYMLSLEITADILFVKKAIFEDILLKQNNYCM